MNERPSLWAEELKQILRIFLGSLIIFATAIGALTYTPGLEDFLVRMDLKIVDVLFGLREYVYVPQSDVIIIKEDDKSADALKVEGSWYKRFHPQLVRQLKGIPQIEAIVFDHDFATPTPYDALFADTIRDISSKVVVGDKTTIPAIRAASPRYGYLGGFVQTKDGVERFLQLAERQAGGPGRAALALIAVTAFYKQEIQRQLQFAEGEVIVRPGLRIPVEEGDLMMINFGGRPGRIPSVSYVDVVKGGRDALQELLRDGGSKIVVVGETSEEYRKDPHNTPVGIMPGVELQANAIHTLLSEKFIRKVQWAGVAGVLFCISVLSCLFVSLGRRLRWMISLWGLVVFSVFVVSFLMFLFRDARNHVVTYWSALILAFLMGVILRVSRVVPRIENFRPPYGELAGMFVASWLALMSGSVPVWLAFCLGMLGPVMILVVRTVRRDIRLGLSLGIFVFWLVAGPAEGANSTVCGKITSVVTYGSKTVGLEVMKSTGRSDRVRIVRDGKEIPEIRVGAELVQGDEIHWNGGVGFALRFLTGTAQAYGPSGTGALVKIDCAHKTVVTHVTSLVGWIQSVVREGTTLKIPIDRMVTAGTRQTSFELQVDSLGRWLAVRVWEGEVGVENVLGGVIVQRFQEAEVWYTTMPQTTLAKISMARLLGRKTWLLEEEKFFALYPAPRLAGRFQAINQEIARKELREREARLMVTSNGK